MIIRVGCCCLWLALSVRGYAQDSIPAHDTTAILNEVVVHAYERNRDLLLAAMPVAVVTANALAGYTPHTALPALNAIPGVRMEERSPASYRLNIRGSAMRAPFGVRNVKVYYNDLPFTDPGGTTYINQLGPLHFAGAEIVKGPGGSLYGAGTGGIVLLRPQPVTATGFKAGYAYGSYQQHTFFATVYWRGKNNTQTLSYQQNSGKGYRSQSASDRKILSWDGSYRLNERQTIKTSVLAGWLHYETPGALTFEELGKDPAAARPAAGNFPSAIVARAAIEQRMIWAGINLETKITNALRNKTGVYGAYVALDNPAIRNYAATTQPHGGIRSVFNLQHQWSSVSVQADMGIEGQTGRSSVTVYNNNQGEPGTRQRSEAVNTLQGLAFAQGSLMYKDWELQLGLSLNSTGIHYSSHFPTDLSWKRSFGPNLMPRITLSRKVLPGAFAWISYSRGFSTPVTEELLPSGSALNTLLQAEEGDNIEAGLRYRIRDRLLLELGAYYFALRNTIVQRRDAGGGDQYINAGSTRQPGIEGRASYEGGKGSWLAYNFTASYAYQPYRYNSFVREQDDYSGKALPGIAVHNVYTGLGLEMFRHYLVQVHGYYNSRMPLNDGNSVYGADCWLVSAKAGVSFARNKFAGRLYAGVDNLLNRRYSAGYDINAAGNRYYNAAPLRNYYLQVILER